MEIALTPVAYVRGGRADAEEDFWGGTTCRIELTDHYDEAGLTGLSDFSHLEIVFVFDRVAADAVETSARHPRNRKDWPLVGIFGQRGKRRPNRLGLSRCTLIEVKGKTLVVEGLDTLDGTPVVDIKPWMEEFGPRGPIRQPPWAAELMRDYYKDAEPSKE